MRFLTIALVAVTLSACATGDYSYTPPEPMKSVATSKVVYKTKNQAWAELIPAIGQNFFAINNLDASSGLVNISYSGDPQEYIDCGEFYSQVSNARGPREYRFPGSVKHTTYETAQGGDLYVFTREMHLQGRINLILQETGHQETTMTVNTKYVVTKSYRLTGSNGARDSRSDTIDINGFERVSFPESDTACQPTGRLEAYVLGLLR